ncbi:hypothetical protein MNQ98_10565 [Paenibacillus sp. N3/727]|uniref:hypothetical protein n=1 Tax=Paenibacillus sp. N3/727 TaxID=2925845 RepID=UPI001F52BEB3|nr:hypothetical protein [Paenibacillus sp. N3/727]UNK20418.1 hypothetical protein MNQ98_10565 [Paenibacillus sp. N3/727]
MRHLINREPDCNTEPPTQAYELGKWHQNRGHFEEALTCFKQAAMAASYTTPTDMERSALSWIEYGRLNAKLNKCNEAAESFKHALCFGMPYAAKSLNEWALLLHQEGICDRDIFNRLLFELSSHSICTTVLGCALREIGAYTEAALCFNMTEYTDTQTGIIHAHCLINDDRLDEAMNLLVSLNNKCALEDSTQDVHRDLISITMFLCKWRLSGSLPYLPAYDDDRYKLAEVAVSLGMLAEADFILSTEGTAGEYALIHMLYSEGYTTLAGTRISCLPEIQVNHTHPYLNELQFITAERLYDLGDYERASVIFENLRLSQPEHTASRFGEAACYLQSSLLSLSSRMARIDSPDTVKEQAMEYMHSINAALHIVENTHWHTIWSPAQRRRENGIGRSTTLN